MTLLSLRKAVSCAMLMPFAHRHCAGEPYMMVVAHQELLKRVRQTAVVGTDTKWGFTSHNLPTIAVSFADAGGRGQVAVFCIVSAETAQIITILLKLLVWNVPCDSADCKHESELRIFQNGSGWYACAFDSHPDCARMLAGIACVHAL